MSQPRIRIASSKATRPVSSALLSITLSITLLSLVAISTLVGTSVAADEEEPRLTRCEMSYDFGGWSFMLKRMVGKGRITCDDGQSAEVNIEMTAVGITFGTNQIKGGRGVFSRVVHVHETFGNYLALQAHAGAGDTVTGDVLSKGGVSLALSGKGRGWNLGVNMGGFTIVPKPGTFR